MKTCINIVRVVELYAWFMIFAIVLMSLGGPRELSVQLDTDSTAPATTMPDALIETCQQAIPSHLYELAGSLETELTCRRAVLPQEAGIGGVFYTKAQAYSPAGPNVIVASHVTPDFYAQIAAHELGHAWMHSLSNAEIWSICEVLGVPDLPWQSEYLADVVAMSLDHYVGEWRTEYPRPTSEMIVELIQSELVPQRSL